MSDLDKLIEAVEGGDEIHCMDIANNILAKNNPYFLYCGSAFRGSLDAAKALHEALLPGWIWERRGSVMVVQHWDTESWHGDTDNPARAWLISILKAYRSQQEKAQ